MIRAAAIGLALLLLVACSTASTTTASTFIVFFHAGSADLTREASASIDRAASAINRSRPTTVAIAAGVAKGNNLVLAEPRFQSVRQALEAKGVKPSLIARASLPDIDANAGETGDQRVEIILGMEHSPH
jgi:outer membrane protein OmpA-like peptidoglycan-associated protein